MIVLVGCDVGERSEFVWNVMVDFFFVWVNICIVFVDIFCDDIGIIFGVVSIFVIFVLYVCGVFEEIFIKCIVYDVVELVLYEFVFIYFVDFFFVLVDSIFVVEIEVNGMLIDVCFVEGYFKLNLFCRFEVELFIDGFCDDLWLRFWCFESFFRFYVVW